MKPTALYSTPVKLEKGDLVALVEGRLWIRSEHNLYVTLQTFQNLSEVPEEVVVNSAGSYSNGKGLFDERPKWTKYHPRTT